MAWKALTEKYSGHTKEARREYHEKLVDTKMEPGQDSEDLFFVLDQYRDLLEENGTDGTRREVRTRASFSKPFLQSTKAYESPATRGWT